MSRYGPRIAALERRAERDRKRLEPEDEQPEPDDATTYLREGAGRAIWLYVEGEPAGGWFVSPAELDALERAMNAWLECYARCYGVKLEADFSIREAAELLLETRNVDDVGQLLTDVPSR
ncbi:hypothetical protein D8S78_10465 [Natrialba swarupiae]|nr:hypothetical protein [Natrialba swarupiae]